MNVQHQIIISLGSNLGDRKDYIQKCIDTIHQQVGTVIKVSSLYESESWGFQSNSFYNAVAVLHSEKKPQKILKSFQKIEKQLGRIPKTHQEYEARTIDIDILAIDDLIFNEEQLTVPHHALDKRNFVLQPLQELLPFWKHPKTQATISELIVHCTDNGFCKRVDSLIAPLHNFNLEQYNYIAIEGNIGAGKTTLAHKMAQDFNAKTVLERFADNPFLPKFYKDQNRYAFPLEMSFLADRYQQITDDLAQFDLFKDFIVRALNNDVLANENLGLDEEQYVFTEVKNVTSQYILGCISTFLKEPYGEEIDSLQDALDEVLDYLEDSVKLTLSSTYL